MKTKFLSYKTLFIAFFTALTFVACNNDENVMQNESITNNTNTSVENNDVIPYLKYTSAYRSQPQDLLGFIEYQFDNEGKVISEHSENYINGYNYTSTFNYNSNGQVTQEIRNGQVHRQVYWTQNTAKVYNQNNVLIAEFNFSGDTLIEYKVYVSTNDIRIRIFNYDSDGNVASIQNQLGSTVEYLNYDTSKKNPYNYLKSIGVLLRFNQNIIFFKNIFGIEKTEAFVGEDYAYPEMLYDYTYEFDSMGRVSQIEDEKTLIYTVGFIYE